MMSLTRDNQRTASYLLPAPGGEVVRQLLDEVEAAESRCAKLEGDELRARVVRRLKKYNPAWGDPDSFNRADAVANVVLDEIRAALAEGEKGGEVMHEKTLNEKYNSMVEEKAREKCRQSLASHPETCRDCKSVYDDCTAWKGYVGNYFGSHLITPDEVQKITATSEHDFRDDFRDIAAECAKITAEKNLAYGSSFSKSGAFLELLYPDGIKTEQFVDALLIARIFDKLMRIANRKDAFGESPYKDIIGYGLCGAVMDENT